MCLCDTQFIAWCSGGHLFDRGFGLRVFGLGGFIYVGFGGLSACEKLWLGIYTSDIYCLESKTLDRYVPLPMSAPLTAVLSVSLSLACEKSHALRISN